MIERTVTAADRGQRLDKYIRRVLPNAGSSFIYKMLRKKNIVLNGSKADGKEILGEGDRVTFWFSDETYAKFSGSETNTAHDDALDAYHRLTDIQVIYEQSELAFIRKPSGVLTQKAQDRDVSLNEWFIGYLIESGQLSANGIWPYTPSVCNRLDRNTGGIVICAKTLLGSRVAAEILWDRSVHKYYRMIVVGRMEGEGFIEGWTRKNERTNQVTFYDREVDGAQYTRTLWKALQYSKAVDCTEIEAELITGKTHQLRVHLSHMGHPILGDPKYGDMTRNRKAAAQGIQYQLLWSQRLELPDFEEPELQDLSGRTIVCEPPRIYQDIMQ